MLESISPDSAQTRSSVVQQEPAVIQENKFSTKIITSPHQKISDDPVVILSPQTAEEEWSYLLFELSSERLNTECRRAIEALGVECLEEGGLYEAYGIARVSRPLLEILCYLKGVQAVSAQEPPCSK